MADDTSATIIPLHQPQKKRAMTPAERQRNCRARKRAAAEGAAKSNAHFIPGTILTGGGASLPMGPRKPDWSSEPNFGESVTLVAPVTVTPVTGRSRPPMSSVLLRVAAFGLAGVGVTINGWFARSLGASDAAGWLFLAIGVAADIAALALPSCAAWLWGAHQRAAAMAGWAIFGLTLVFAVTASLGFASQNIADVTLSRSSRVTAAVTSAETALADAMAARDRECRGGVGRFCRERESQVVERRQAVDSAMQRVGATADPQAEAAAHLVAWASLGVMRPGTDDVAMLRLMLLALLPQLGGLLLMIGRAK